MKKRQKNSADRRERRILVIFLAVTAVLVAIWAATVGVKSTVTAERTNKLQSGTPRVYDEADMLTDLQEDALEEKIGQVEKEIKADIVIVVINESLEKKYPDLLYMRNDETDAYRGIQRYAESFWEEKGFGWNDSGKNGNGIIRVDNIYRESNGWVYNWVAGAGDLRFSVGDESCHELSQAFTDRLPSGDLPPYTDVYADSLMAFVADCGDLGSNIHTMLSWSAFSPSGIVISVTSSIISFLAVICLVGIILGRMFWQLNYNGRKRQKKNTKRKFSIGWSMIWVIWAIFLSVQPAVGTAIIFAMIIYFIVSSGVKGKGRSGSQKEKGRKEAPFSYKEPLEPDLYHVDRKDEFIRHYVTTVSHDSSSSGGSSGSSSGGGGGGGFSGGGSHR